MNYLYYVLIFLGYIMALPTSRLTGLDLLKSLPVLLCLLGIMKFSLFQKGRIFIGQVSTKIKLSVYSIFVFIYFASILRRPGITKSVIGMVNASGQVILIAFLTFVFINYCLKRGKEFIPEISKISFAIISAPAIFIILNIGTYLLGIEIPLDLDDPEAVGKPSVIAGLLGLNLIRNTLLFVAHPNNVATAVGSILVCSFFAWKYLTLPKWQSIFLLVSILAGMTFMLMLDSRGSIASLLAVSTLVIFLERARMLSLIKRLIIFLPLLPFFILSLLALVSSTDLGKNMAREENDDDLNTGNGRAIIWEHCINAILDPEVDHILGYGQAGHVTSGVERYWAWKFPNYVAHNFFFQSFFDIGYIGIIFFVWLLYISASSAIYLYNKGIKAAIIFIAFSLYYPLSGMFESIFGIYNHPYTTIVITYTLCPILFKSAYLIHFNKKELEKQNSQ